MMRDVNTPLVLWICAAICAHYVFAEGGDTVAQVHEDRMAIASLGAKVRERVRFGEQTFEVSSLSAGEKPTEQQPPVAPPPPPKTKDKDEAKVVPNAPKPPPPSRPPKRPRSRRRSRSSLPPKTPQRNSSSLRRRPTSGSPFGST